MNIKNLQLTNDDIEDAILLRIAKIVEADENRPHVDNEDVIEKINSIYEIVKSIFSGYYKIEKAIHDPFHSMAYIKMTGKKIECNNGLAFYELRRFVDNTDMYCLANGDVVISFTFHGVTKFIDG